MSKRLVLCLLFLLTGIPMLASPTAPLGLVAVATAAGLLALPRLGERTTAH